MRPMFDVLSQSLCQVQAAKSYARQSPCGLLGSVSSSEELKTQLTSRKSGISIRALMLA